MVTQFGMSRMGRIFVKESNDNPFLAGSSWSTGMGCSEQMAREIDAEIRKIIDDSVDEVRELLAARRNALVALADKLIEKETIDGAQVLALIEAHYPGPKLVLGTSPVTPSQAPRVTPNAGDEESRRAECTAPPRDGGSADAAWQVFTSVELSIDFTLRHRNLESRLLMHV